jgi:hypothetical protein
VKYLMLTLLFAGIGFSSSPTLSDRPPIREVQGPQFDNPTDNISANLYLLWDSYERGDSEEHSDMLADGFAAVYADGSVHIGKPTAEEIKAAPITRFALADSKFELVGTDVYLVTYVADVDVPQEAGTERKAFSVGEIWVKEQDIWVCRYHQETRLKKSPLEIGAEPGLLQSNSDKRRNRRSGIQGESVRFRDLNEAALRRTLRVR